MNHTPCKNCAFAEYRSDTQVDCRLKLIDKFQEKGIEVLEAYDEDKEFYVIKRQCHFFRPEGQWGKDLGESEKLDKVKEETRCAFNVVVFDDNDVNETIKTLNSVYMQDFKPVKVTVIRKSNNSTRPSDLIERLGCGGIPWKIENNIAEWDEWRAFDNVRKFSKQPYFLILKAGDTIEDDYLERINKAIIEDFEVFWALVEKRKDSYFGTIPSKTVIPLTTYLHVLLQVAWDLNPLQKMMGLETSTLKLIRTMEEVCPR